MARAARLARTGGPEVIEFADVEVGAPGAGEVRLRHTAVGLNFIDTYHRSGLYPMAMPTGLGMEAAGVVEAVGEGVESLAAGDRVAYGTGPIGAYATHRLIAAGVVVKLPDAIDDRTAGAAMLKGGTTEFLVERCAKVQAGETVLVHAAAGGVGGLLVQWLKGIGARVIAVVGSDAKAEIARGHGADHVIVGESDGLAAKVAEITGGARVRVVFDGIGKATWEASLDCLARRGLMVSYGNASGPVEGVNLGVLARKGSLFATRPTMFDYYVTPAERQAGAARLFDMILSGKLKVPVGQTYALEDAAKAHIDLEARRTTGATILLP